MVIKTISERKSVNQINTGPWINEVSNQSEEPLLDTCDDLPEMGDNILFSKIIKIENRLKICKVPSLSVIGQFSLKECELIWPYLLYYQNHKKKPTVKNLSKSGSLKDRKKN